MDDRVWQAAVHGVAKSWTQLSDFPFTFHFQTLEKEMTTHSSFPAWRIPGIEEPGGLPSMGSQESDTTEATQQQKQLKISTIFKSLHIQKPHLKVKINGLICCYVYPISNNYKHIFYLIIFTKIYHIRSHLVKYSIYFCTLSSQVNYMGFAPHSSES